MFIFYFVYPKHQVLLICNENKEISVANLMIQQRFISSREEIYWGLRSPQQAHLKTKYMYCPCQNYKNTMKSQKVLDQNFTKVVHCTTHTKGSNILVTFNNNSFNINGESCNHVLPFVCGVVNQRTAVSVIPSKALHFLLFDASNVLLLHVQLTMCLIRSSMVYLHPKIINYIYCFYYF